MTVARKNKAKDLSGTIKQMFFSNGKSHNLLERTFSFHLNPKKSCWEVPVTTQLSFKEKTFNTNLESLRYNDHFELEFVQIGQQLTKRQPRKVLGTGKQSDFF